jgi:hypothetical protein
MNVQEIATRQGFEHGAPEKIREPVMSPPKLQEVRPETGENRGKGVVRLLMEGHFKGVADVRLRINFMDELRQAAGAQAGETFKEGLGELAEKVPTTTRDALAGLLQDGRLTEEDVNEAIDAFALTAEGIMAQADEVGTGNALSQLGEALAALESSLGTALPTGDQPPVEDTEDGSTTVTPQSDRENAAAEPVESVSESTSALSASPLEELRSELAGLLQNLTEAVEQSEALPPLSQPNGNGRAYAMFLATYSEMTGNAVGTESTAENLDMLI